MQFTDRQAVSYLLLASGGTNRFGALTPGQIAAIEGLPAVDRAPVLGLFATGVRESLPFDINCAIAAANSK